MKSISSKNIEKKLERKQGELLAAMESRRKLEEKIRGLREEIGTLQSAQLEQIFQQVKKSILKEGLHLDAETIPDILRTIRDSQEPEDGEKTEGAAPSVFAESHAAPASNGSIETVQETGNGFAETSYATGRFS